jgi:hypothetical protein
MRSEEVSPELRELTFNFFHRFSRLEFALKEAGYLKNKNPGSWAIPDWDQFVAEWKDQYVPSENAVGLIEAAPQEQVIAADGRSVEFRDVAFHAQASTLGKVVKLARTVRNNLFHGGKHDAAGWDDAGRMELLLPLSTAVLGELALLAGVESDYEGAY